MSGWGHFARLFEELHSSNKTEAKIRALETYFRHATPEDGITSLWFLLGNRLPRPIRSKDLRQWVAQVCGLPDFLVEESYEAVGDLAETLSLLLETKWDWIDEDPLPLDLQSLSGVVNSVIVPLKGASPAKQLRILMTVWKAFTREERLLVHKLLLGAFRVGVGRNLVLRGLARAFNRSVTDLALALTGNWEPCREVWQQLVTGPTEPESGAVWLKRNLSPYPFYLAHPWEGPVEDLGPSEEWQAEWKWDGIRGQIVRRDGKTAIWTRGEDLVTHRYPELAEASQLLPDGMVLDGEIVVWRSGAPRPESFQLLQSRMNRDRPGAAWQRKIPVVFLAYDILEWKGEDVRNKPIEWRGEHLRNLLPLQEMDSIRCPPVLEAKTWTQRAQLRDLAREKGTEGLMLKRLGSAYGQGRIRGNWWKWKVNPLTIDAVLIHAMAGHGKRASLFTDYTFALWHEGQLLPVGRAYSGLTDAEIRKVDAFIRRNTVQRQGAFRSVRPELVMELGFDSVQASARHKSGLALRFPRILRWRTDKSAAEADQLETLRTLVKETPVPTAHQKRSVIQGTGPTPAWDQPDFLEEDSPA
jgi:DNA ligase-1